MNTRILTKLLRKAGSEVIEAFDDWTKRPTSFNESDGTISKRNLGKFINKEIKPLLKNTDTTEIIGRSKSNPQGKKTDLIEYLGESLSKTNTYMKKGKPDRFGKRKIKYTVNKYGKKVPETGKKSADQRWDVAEKDLNTFLTTGLKDLRAGSSMRKENIGRKARGEPEFIYEDYRESTINKLKDIKARRRAAAAEVEEYYIPGYQKEFMNAMALSDKVEKQVQQEVNSDQLIRFLYNKLKGRNVGKKKITQADILNYLEKGTIGISAKDAKRAVTDVDQMALPLSIKPETFFGQRGFKGEGPVSGVTKIISGGQTGVDETGLIVARNLGLDIGGTAPKNYKRNNIKNARLSTDDLKNNLKESTSSNYNVRTQDNVLDSDGTVIFGDITSPGTNKTIQILKKVGKPFKINPSASVLKNFVSKNNIKTLNVAGNRGTKEGMVFADRAEKVLTQALKKEKGQVSPDAQAWQRFTQAVKDDPETFRDFEINQETGLAQKRKRDPLAQRESELMPSGGGPTLQDVVRGRYSSMAEIAPEPKPWQQELLDQGYDVDLSDLYKSDARSLLSDYRGRLQSAFGPDISGYQMKKNTSVLLDISPEEKALLSAEEKFLVERAEKVYLRKYYERKQAGDSDALADELAREEVDATMGERALDEDFSFTSPEKAYIKNEKILTDPVDLRPSRQYSLNDLVPDPNIRKTIRERLTPDELAKVIQEFNTKYYRTQGTLKRHISDIPIKSQGPIKGAGRYGPNTMGGQGTWERDIQSSFMNFLLGEERYAKGGKVKAKKKTKFIPKIIKNRNIKGKKKVSKPLGVGAAQRGWGAVRSA